MVEDNGAALRHTVIGCPVVHPSTPTPKSVVRRYSSAPPPRLALEY